MKVKTPSKTQVFNDLRKERNYLKANFGHENPKVDGDYPDELNYSCDVRLQVYEDGSWSLRTGSSDYDQDHRGFWGASSIVHFSANEELKDVALDLIDQVQESMAIAS